MYASSTGIIARLLIRPLETAYPPSPAESFPPADAIVVLSGGIIRGQNAAGIQWGESANRYFAGYALAKAHRARLLVLSAGLPRRRAESGSGEMLRRAAIGQGIDPNQIVVTPFVQTTEDEAREVSRIPGVRSVILVTSAFHLPRAVLLFRARGLNVLPYPTDERATLTETAPLDFVPQASNIELSELALREYYGLIVYRTILLFRPAYLKPSALSNAPAHFAPAG